MKANTLWNSVGCFFYLGCQWITTVLVVTLSPNYSNSGILAFAMATGIVFSAIALYSIRTFQVSDLENKFSNANYIAFRLCTILFGYALCFGYLIAITNDTSLIITSLLYLLFKTDEAFSDVMYGIYQRHLRMDYIGRSQIMRGVLSLSGFTIPLAISHNLNLAIITMTAACFVVTVAYDIPHSSLFGSSRPSISIHDAFILAKTCLPAMIASVCACAIATIVRQLYGIQHGDEALGVYAAIATPAVLVQVAANYLYSPWIGSLAQANLKSSSCFLKLFAKLFVALIAVVLSVTVLLTPIGERILIVVYGPGISSNIDIFPYVLLATGSVGILFFVHNVLVILRRFFILLAADACGLLFSVISASFLIEIYDMNGINFAIIGGCIVGITIALIGIIGPAMKKCRELSLSKTT